MGGARRPDLPAARDGNNKPGGGEFWERFPRCSSCRLARVSNVKAGKSDVSLKNVCNDDFVYSITKMPSKN
jgi:hypothetical protein